MKISRLFARTPGDNTALNFAQGNNPDCPQQLRDAIFHTQAGRPGFGPHDMEANPSLNLIGFSLHPPESRNERRTKDHAVET